MSRGQETTAFNTADTQNAGYYNGAQNSYANAQTDAGDYEKQLSSYSSQNPYNPGGAFQTATNQQLTNTSDAMARSVGNQLQEQALRTGQNTSGAVAATEQMEQANERQLSGQEASATQTRIGDQAGYNKSVLQASEVPEQMEAGLASSQAGAGNSALGTEVNAGKTPSWMDEFGDAFAQQLGGGRGRG